MVGCSGVQQILKLQESMQPFKSSNLPTGDYDMCTHEQQELYKVQVAAARKAVKAGLLQPVPAGDGNLKCNKFGALATCVLLPNADKNLQTCPLVEGVPRCGHYPDQCPLNGKVNVIGKKKTQRAQSNKANEKIAALVQLAEVVTSWGDADMDPDEKQKLTTIKETLAKLE